MKKILSIYEPHMARPIVYGILKRIIFGLIGALLWDRFLNTEKIFTVVEYGFLFAAVIFFAAAWLNYLSLDGMSFHHINEKRSSKPAKKSHSVKQTIDFIDEDYEPTPEITAEGKKFIALIANFVTAFCFLLPSVIAAFI